MVIYLTKYILKHSPLAQLKASFTGISPRKFNLSAISMACLTTVAMSSPAGATPLSLSQTPAGSGGREPAPNIIVSVDDSGSLQQYGIDALRTALTDTFSTTNVADDRIRLAWQSMNRCPSIPSASAACKNLNSLQRFSGTHRTDFMNWTNTLTYGGGTPSHWMFKNAGEYLKAATTGINNPWGSNPGTTESPVLACRRSYHIFMTDGNWNSGADKYPYVNGHIDGDRHLFIHPGNADATVTSLPDSTSYPPTGNYATLYSDNWGFKGNQTANTSMSFPDYTNPPLYPQITRQWKPDNLSTLSDMAFYYWSTDLRSDIANSVRSSVKVTGSENITVGTTNYSLPEYWNPKNDPATWQHMVTYTIGFSSSTAPADDVTQWTGTPAWGGGTYSGDYAKLATGNVTWPSPLCQANYVNAVQNDPNSRDTVGGNTACDGTYGYSARSNERKIELWHAAINGRGQFIPATTAGALSTAFKGILDNIISDTSKPLVSIAANTASLRSDSSVYLAGYDATNWSGSLVSRPVTASTSTISSTENWNETTLLAASTYDISKRFVASYDSLATPSAQSILWTTYDNLPTLQKTPLNKNSSGTVDNNGQSRMDYIRGDRTKEASTSGGIFRSRSSRLGDIVNSNIWYTGKPANGYTANNYATFRSTTATGGKGGRTPMLYVGANDGILHGFAASDSTAATGGKELLAYIPEGIAQGNLRNLTDTTYTHQYFVDGSPFTGDAYIGTTPAWTTVLTGTLGAGGKGYFILDVTDPANFSTSNVAKLVIKDTTASTDADLGYITGLPVVDDTITGKSRQVVKINYDNNGKNVGRWATILGNGANSTNEAPVLLIQYLDGDKSIQKVSPCTQPIASNACAFKGGNGLSAPQLIDLNGDGTVDVAYAGDLQGNLWKFDLTSKTPSNWTTAFSGQPFFVAKQSAGVVQPITTAPYWQQHPQGGLMIAVGTGRLLTVADQTSTGTDTFYALWDKATMGVADNIVTLAGGSAINKTTDATLPSTLVQQTLTGPTVDSGNNYYTSSTNAVVYTGSSPKRGWYLNFPNAGQRVLSNPAYYSGQQVLVQSTIPLSGSTGETCTPTAGTQRTFLSVMNLFTGQPPTVPPFVLSTTTVTNHDNAKITTQEFIPGGDTKIFRGNEVQADLKITSACAAGQSCSMTNSQVSKYRGLRANWREIQ